MSQIYFKEKRNAHAVFDLLIRSGRRPFYAAGGIEEFLDYVENLKFSKKDIEYLRSSGLFGEECLK